MYDKKEIDGLYKSYAESRSEEVLEQLITACEPIIGIVLAKYEKYNRHAEDMRQEVKLRMWKNLRLRTGENLARYYQSPTTYLYFLIRTYVRRAFRRLHNVYKEDIEVTVPHKEMAELAKD